MWNLPDALYRATQGIKHSDLESMVLNRNELPVEVRDFQKGRETKLDNGTMASQGFPGSTLEQIESTGRLMGYLREFISPIQPESLETGSNLVVATIVHLFSDSDCVSYWMTEKFLADFKRFVGKDLANGQKLEYVKQISVDGFWGKSVGLHTVQTTQIGTISSTIVDFAVDRILAVAYVVAMGDVERKELVCNIGMDLEKRIVRVILE
jgi:hypothetical protein